MLWLASCTALYRFLHGLPCNGESNDECCNRQISQILTIYYFAHFINEDGMLHCRSQNISGS